MKTLLIVMCALVSLPASAMERVSATRVDRDVYKLEDGRVVITTGCPVSSKSEEAIINDKQDMLIFMDAQEQCEVKGIR